MKATTDSEVRHAAARPAVPGRVRGAAVRRERGGGSEGARPARGGDGGQREHAGHQHAEREGPDGGSGGAASRSRERTTCGPSRRSPPRICAMCRGSRRSNCRGSGVKVAVLVQDAIAMAEAARAHQQVFVGNGRAENFADALLAAAAAVRASIDARAKSIATKAGARGWTQGHRIASAPRTAVAGRSGAERARG